MLGVILFTLVTFIISLFIVMLNSHLVKNEKEEKILLLLPGYNCGACGFGSCEGMKNELLKDKTAIDKCRFLSNNREEILKILKER